MSDLFRETALGQLVRLTPGGKRWLAYPEEKDDWKLDCPWANCEKPIKPPAPPNTTAATSATSVTAPVAASPPDAPFAPPPQDEESLRPVISTTSTAVEKATSSGVRLVHWYDDSDPGNPQNWSKLKKGVVVAQIGLLTFAVYVGSSLIVSGFASLIADFGKVEEEVTTTLSVYVFFYGFGALVFSPLSEIALFGRNPFYIGPMVLFVALQAGAATVNNFAGLVILRALTALFGAPVLSTGGGTLVDMYSPLDLPVMLAIWVLPAFSAPALGPIIGNSAAFFHGWRWTMWELLWLTGFTTLILFVFLPETSHDNILLRRAVRIRARTGRSELQAQSEITRGEKRFNDVFFDAIIKPFEITLKDPSIAFANVYIAVVYATYYLYFTAFPLLYLRKDLGGEGYHHFTFITEGAAYLCILVGAVIGFAIYVEYQIFYMKPYIAHAGWPVNEKRLEPALISSAFTSIGLWIFAWTSINRVNWSGSMVGTANFAASNFVTLQCVFFYIVLSYPAYGASLLAANDFLRAAAAAGLLHAGAPMFRAMGLAGGLSFLAGVTMFGVPGVWCLYHFGARLRARSRFAQGDGQ